MYVHIVIFIHVTVCVDVDSDVHAGVVRCGLLSSAGFSEPIDIFMRCFVPVSICSCVFVDVSGCVGVTAETERGRKTKRRHMYV